MSRAFVKDGDDGADEDALPERPVPTHANYVTARGLARLQARTRELTAQCETLRRAAADDTNARQALRVAERDLRYFNAQLERAALVETGPQRHDEVHFGARVSVVGDDGQQRVVRIVGDDEADAAVGDISWASPLARALIGARVGDSVVWRRPAGDADIEVLAIQYEPT